ncbi:MAG: hypothetical protein E2O39_06090 [Planctomycetota bacterium]|nr:MAG: hypothetical protein E2O39_06090 [Planctomycetota bacterium]
MPTPPRNPPTWLWLLPAPVIIAAQLITKAAGGDAYRTWFRGETGIVENLTVVFLLVALVAALAAYRQRKRVAARRFGPFMLVMALGCFFFAGEEASWGQHWFGFDTPAAIAERNDQGEFNLHNDEVLEAVLDQLPRNLLTLAALVGGVIMAAGRRLRHREGFDFASPSSSGWIWPTIACLPAAFFAITVSLPEKVYARAGLDYPTWLDISPGETKEFCLGLFLMVYLLTILRSVRAAGVETGTGDAGAAG